jgi:hypothetical protein
MLKIVLPHALISISVGPRFDTLSFHLSVYEFSFVFCVIWPDHDAEAGDVVFVELSVVNLSSVREIILSLTFELTIFEVTFVEVAIELKSTLSGLSTILEITLVLNGCIVPGLGAFSVILVVFPFTSVH